MAQPKKIVRHDLLYRKKDLKQAKGHLLDNLANVPKAQMISDIYHDEYLMNEFLD